MRSLHTTLSASILCEGCGLAAQIGPSENRDHVRFCPFCGARVDTEDPGAAASVLSFRSLAERTLERLDSLCDKTKAPMHDAITAELLLSRERFRALLDGIQPAPPILEAAPRPGMFRVVNGDNFGGDYPNETFVNVQPTNQANAQAIADAINKAFCYWDTAPRFWRVEPDGYKLQPGFEP